jgi:hypothetical protein
MSKRTYYATVTPEGTRRKRSALIADILLQECPEQYLQYALRADEIIKIDNRDAQSKIQDSGLNVVHNESENLRKAKKNKRRQLNRWLRSQEAKDSFLSRMVEWE